MENLTKKYRLTWDINTLIIKNAYQLDYSGSITNIINSGDLGIFESDVYQDILDKISQESLIDNS